MFSSNVAAIQGLCLRRLNSLPYNPLKSLSAYMEGSHFFFRAVLQTELPNSQIEQFNNVMSEIAGDLKHVFGEQLSIRLDMILSPDDYAPLEIEIFNSETTQ